MIKLARVRAGDAVPPDFQGNKLRTKHGDLVKLYYASQPIKFASSAKWKSAKNAIKADSGDKCAYCEAHAAAVSFGDVEHFRPKSIYWWLAYCFDNYLFSCQKCNQEFKGDNFPVTGQRLRAPTMPGGLPNGAALTQLSTLLMLDPTQTTDAACIQLWSGESADLINPYFEDPEPLFKYAADTDNKEVWIRPAAGARAAAVHGACEKYLGLNRGELRSLRYVSYEALAMVRLAYEAPGLSAQRRQEIEAWFQRVRDRIHPFAGMHRYFLREWGL
jgi:hypothetical protein